jgi:hypothetical protein
MRLRTNELCPIHKSHSCCGRELLPKPKLIRLEILMTDDARGTLHGLLHVRAPEDVFIPRFQPHLYPTLRQSREDSVGANLRFKSTALVPVGRRRRAGGWL